MSAGEDIPEAYAAPIAALAEEMARHGRARAAPVREVMALLGDRWTTLLLIVLSIGPWRHAALRRAVARLSAEQKISQRMLTLKLRALERDGFVLRSISGDVPPRVAYALTPLGEGLAGQARGVVDWVNAQAEAIHAARAVFDAAEGD